MRCSSANARVQLSELTWIDFGSDTSSFKTSATPTLLRSEALEGSRQVAMTLLPLANSCFVHCSNSIGRHVKQTHVCLYAEHNGGKGCSLRARQEHYPEYVNNVSQAKTNGTLQRHHCDKQLMESRAYLPLALNRDLPP